MSIWNDFELEDRITSILNVESHAPDHHFGNPFLTPYQIAIVFSQTYPEEFVAIGKPVGGKNIGQQNSLAQYFALELSKRIKDNQINHIEGRFLHRRYLKALEYETGEETIESSSGQAYDLSIFRLID